MTLVLRFGLGAAARFRFAVSPLQETMTALLVLKNPGRHGGYLTWLRAVQHIVAELDLACSASPRRATDTARTSCGQARAAR